MRRLFALVLTAVAAFTTAVFTATTNAIPFPDDYRHWTHVKSTLIGPDQCQLRVQQRRRRVGLGCCLRRSDLRRQCPGSQVYAPQAGGSGIDNVYINAKWLVKASGTFQLPYGVNLGANFNSRQGYPFPQAMITPNRANSGGQATVLLDPLGDNRLPAFTQVDVRVDRNFMFGRVQLKPTFDVFNLTNANTVLARRQLQPRPWPTISAASSRLVWRVSPCSCAGKELA